MSRPLVFVFTGFFACLTLASCSFANRTFTLGFLGGLSGPQADLGESGRNGALLAVDGANQNDALSGRLVRLEIRDDKNDPKAARQAALDLAGLGVAALVGPFTSAMTSSVLEVAQPAGLLVFSPTASSGQFDSRKDVLLRLASSTKDNARSYADFAVNSQGYRSFVLVCDGSNGAYTETWETAFQNAVTAHGARILGSDKFSSRAEIHYNEMAKRLVAAQAEAMVFVTGAIDAARLCQQVRAINPRVAILVAEWAGTEALIELGGRAVNGVETLELFDPWSDSPEYKAFAEKYRQRFAAEPSFSSVLAFETVTIILQAERTRKTGQSLQEAILRGGPYRGLQQTFAMDAFGDVKRKISFVRVSGDHFEAIR